MGGSGISAPTEHLRRHHHDHEQHDLIHHLVVLNELNFCTDHDDTAADDHYHYHYPADYDYHDVSADHDYDDHDPAATT